jgi:hypothetical protein
MAIKISSLKKPRREGKAEFTFQDEETKEIRTEEIPISFLKPTEELWDELVAMEKSVGTDEEAQKGLFVRRLVRVEIQSTEFVEDDGRPYNVKEADLKALDLVQVAQLWEGVKKYFFLQTPTPKSETTTNSTSEPAPVA